MRLLHLRSVAPSTAALVLILGLGAPASAQVAAPQAPGDGVTIIAGDVTRAAFAKGTPLIETASYKVHASRREGPGTAEVHARDIDIFYVLEGSATLLTGGRPVDAKTTAPDEVRAPSIEGGTTRPVAKGDVIIIPNGVPHWFKEVRGPFLYYTVKVPTPAGAPR
jgi:glc operon protein GlcG